MGASVARRIRPRRARGTASGPHAFPTFATRSVANPTGPRRGPVVPSGTIEYPLYPQLSELFTKRKRSKKRKDRPMKARFFSSTTTPTARRTDPETTKPRQRPSGSFLDWKMLGQAAGRARLFSGDVWGPSWRACFRRKSGRALPGRPGAGREAAPPGRSPRSSCAGCADPG